MNTVKALLECSDAFEKQKEKVTVSREALQEVMNATADMIAMQESIDRIIAIDKIAKER